jgi:hypothetical protein
MFLYPFNFDTIGGILIHWLLHYTLFCEARNYRTQVMQAHASTRMSYFCILNVIISQLIVHKEGLLSVCAIASWSSPPSHVCICNSHPGSELCWFHCPLHNFIEWKVWWWYKLKKSVIFTLLNVCSKNRSKLCKAMKYSCPKKMYTQG